MQAKVIIRAAGSTQWTQETGDKYVVTGTDRRGKRFRITTNSWLHARGINLWRGTKWLERAGKRYLLTRAFN
jgi:hypothetical protein